MQRKRGVVRNARLRCSKNEPCRSSVPSKPRPLAALYVSSLCSTPQLASELHADTGRHSLVLHPRAILGAACVCMRTGCSLGQERLMGRQWPG
jgi:hypothetical protein